MSDHIHEEDHSGPIKTPKQLLIATVLAFAVPVFIIIGLVNYVVSAPKPMAGAVNVDQAVAERMQKVGTIDVRDANRPLKNGEQVFNGQCGTCHATGVAGAPKFRDAGAWSPRIKTGLAALVNSSLKGKGAMAPQGGGDFSDVEIARAVVFMANAAGATFTEPKPAAAAPAPAK